MVSLKLHRQLLSLQPWPEKAMAGGRKCRRRGGEAQCGRVVGVGGRVQIRGGLYEGVRRPHARDKRVADGEWLPQQSANFTFSSGQEWLCIQCTRPEAEIAVA